MKMCIISVQVLPVQGVVHVAGHPTIQKQHVMC